METIEWAGFLHSYTDSRFLTLLELILLLPPRSVEAKEGGGWLVHEATHGGGHRTGPDLNCQPQLHQETEVVTGNVGMRTADNLRLLQPLLTVRAEYAERLHRVFGVEDVVDDPLEVESIVSEGHHLGGVCAGHVEGVSELLIVLAVTEHLEEAVLVPDVFELVVLRAHPAPLDVLDRPGLRHAVEI